MNYGVIIKKGVSPYQIFQQQNGKATIMMEGEYYATHQSFELPLAFETLSGKKALIKARVALEESGESVIPWTEAEVIDDKNWQICFVDVPAGGPYRIETYMEYEGWDGLSSTRGDMVHFVGVGDVFLIAGQSNACGRSKTPLTDTPEIGVHVFRPNGRWDLATHPLGETTDAVYVGNFENHNPGHSPWLHFAKLLKKELGYPIGLVPCAYGGAPLRWWNPDENGALFDNMMQMTENFPVYPRAVLWYQGEAEGFENAADTYFDRFRALVQHFRKSFHDEKLPVFTVQMNRCLENLSLELDRQWGKVREAQRRAGHEIEGVYVVPATDVALYDFIHNGSAGNLVVGERVANAALDVLYEKKRDWRAPEILQAVKIAPAQIRVSFGEIRNWLNPYEVPPEKLPFEAEDEEGLISAVSYKTFNDGLEITFARDFIGKAVLHGMWRMDPGCAVPCDCMRLPILSFYGFPITE